MKEFTLFSYKNDRLVFKNKKSLDGFYDYIKQSGKVIIKIDNIEQMFENSKLFNKIEKGKIKLSIYKKQVRKNEKRKNIK